MISNKPGGQAFTRGDQVNGHSLSRVPAAGDAVILAVAGELDISSAEEFSDEVRSLAGGEEGEVVLSLQNCGFIDSTGIRAATPTVRRQGLSDPDDPKEAGRDGRSL